MEDSPKYLIHADFRASGIVERSDVVGAIFGQTEGLLGDELDLRDLQESSKMGRIDVDLTTEGGRSFGTVTVASDLDRVETAVLAAGLETIERIGPCRADLEVADIEDARAAKRREVVERATELLADYEDSALTSHELVEEVRQNVRVEDVTEYEGYPAGPRLEKSDAIIVVEGRADVIQLLTYGIKTTIAVEGTDIPDAIADLTRERTVTAFLDGDRGGDLILKELEQVGSVDYVTFAPHDKSVEDLARDEVLSALRKKVPYDEIADSSSPRAVVGGDESQPERLDADGGAQPVNAGPTTTSPDVDVSSDDKSRQQPDQGGGGDEIAPESAGPGDQSATPVLEEAEAVGEAGGPGKPAEDPADGQETVTLVDHVREVIGEDSGDARLLDDEFETIAETGVGTFLEAIEDAGQPVHTVVLDGELSQRLLDVAAQRDVAQVVARSEGEFVKQPTSVRIRTAEAF